MLRNTRGGLVVLVLGVDDVLELGVGEILSSPRVSVSSSRSLFFIVLSAFSVVTFAYYLSVY